MQGHEADQRAGPTRLSCRKHGKEQGWQIRSHTVLRREQKQTAESSW